MTDALCEGVDETGNPISYAEIQALMTSSGWYTGCHDWYDNHCSPTIEGMLGGLTFVHGQETAWTQAYLRGLSARGLVHIGTGSEALDCGAGIGRVAHYALKPMIEFVDILDGTEAYVKASEENFARNSIRNRFFQPLEYFDPSLLGDLRYDLIWAQWLIGHLADDDVVSLLQKLTLLLKPGGKIILKDNCLSEGFMFDRQDTNLLRNASWITSLIERAGLQVLESTTPANWPPTLYPIRAILIGRPP